MILILIEIKPPKDRMNEWIKGTEKLWDTVQKVVNVVNVVKCSEILISFLNGMKTHSWSEILQNEGDLMEWAFRQSKGNSC